MGAHFFGSAKIWFLQKLTRWRDSSAENALSSKGLRGSTHVRSYTVLHKKRCFWLHRIHNICPCRGCTKRHEDKPDQSFTENLEQLLFSPTDKEKANPGEGTKVQGFFGGVKKGKQCDRCFFGVKGGTFVPLVPLEFLQYFP